VEKSVLVVYLSEVGEVAFAALLVAIFLVLVVVFKFHHIWDMGVVIEKIRTKYELILAIK
jgi:uncharacterized membrane protein YccC